MAVARAALGGTVGVGVLPGLGAGVVGRRAVGVVPGSTVVASGTPLAPGVGVTTVIKPSSLPVSWIE